jgi:hypothetical protein
LLAASVVDPFGKFITGVVAIATIGSLLPASLKQPVANFQSREFETPNAVPVFLNF